MLMPFMPYSNSSDLSLIINIRQFADKIRKIVKIHICLAPREYTKSQNISSMKYLVWNMMFKFSWYLIRCEPLKNMIWLKQTRSVLLRGNKTLFITFDQQSIGVIKTRSTQTPSFLNSFNSFRLRNHRCRTGATCQTVAEYWEINTAS